MSYPWPRDADMQKIQGLQNELTDAKAELERLREENEELKAEIAGPQAWADYIIARDARRAALEEEA